MEEWKDIKGYEGLYQVSSEGRVKSLEKSYNVGYGGIKHQDEFYPVINHKDENPKNNNVENLEWCTQGYNNTYGGRTQRMAESQSKKVYQYTLDGELVKIWNSTRECREEGYSQGHVAACCRGERKQHKGYKWSYEPL